MTFKLPQWITKNRGKATAGFKNATQPAQAKATQPARVSTMVKKSAPGLQDGPKPPGHLYAAGKRQEFNTRWREEHRAALATQSSRARSYAAFKQASDQNMSR